MPRLVLVADGSPSHQRRAQGILTGEGLEVITVSNGVAAIKKLPTVEAALVLADVSMPGRDGYEVCDFVKNSPELSRVPVLLSYSEQTPFDEERAQRARADGRIKKPFGQDELLEVINRYLPPEEAVAPPPPPPPPVQTAPEEADTPEPAEMPPEQPPRADLPDLGALSDVSAFSDQSLTEEPPELAPPPISFEEALARAAEETGPTDGSSTQFGVYPGSETPEGGEPAGHSEPMLVEEPQEASQENEEEPVARTMMFRMPVQLAEPVLADDSSATPPQTEEPPPPAAAPPEEATFPEATEQGGSEAEEVSPPPPAEEPAAPAPIEEPTAETPSAAPEVPPAEEAAQASAAVLDTELVHWIVHNVVVRMAPPALSTTQVEELIRQITDEMINDLTQPPPEV